MIYSRYILAVLLLLPLSKAAASDLLIKPYTKTSFNPSIQEQFDFTVLVPTPGKLTVDILSPDGDLVKTLIKHKAIKAKHIQLRWDGKDKQGHIVADEAWLPRVSLQTTDGKTLRYDPGSNTGGEVINSIPVRLEQTGAIHFQLPVAARILARAGIKSGPMMKALANWQPRAAGANVLHWNGLDQSSVVNIMQNHNAAVMLIAYQLQDKAIITTGNKQKSYAQYHSEKAWPQTRKGRRVLGKTRNGKPLSAAYFEPKYWPLSPKVELTLRAPERTIQGESIAILEKPSAVVVNVPQHQRWILERGLFEVGFFIDKQFIAEEEQGYLPFYWKLDPAGLKPGKHILTVNISGFEGQIALASTVFYIPSAKTEKK